MLKLTRYINWLFNAPCAQMTAISRVRSWSFFFCKMKADEWKGDENGRMVVTSRVSRVKIRLMVKKNYLIWLTCQARTENDRNSNLRKFADDKKIQVCILAQSLSMIAMNTSVLRANLLGNDRRRELCFDLQWLSALLHLMLPKSVQQYHLNSINLLTFRKM